MTLQRTDAGFVGDFRFKGLPRLRLSMRTTRKAEARARYEAVRVLFRQRRAEMIAQLRAGVLTVERVAAMVEHGEPLVPLAVGGPGAAAPETVRQVADRWLAWIEASPKKSSGTYEGRRAQIRHFMAFPVDGTPVGDLAFEAVTSAVVQAYQRWQLVEQKTPANTVTGRMTAVGALWRWVAKQEARAAQEERRAPRAIYSPVDGEMTFRKTTARERYLDPTEADRLLAATPEPLLAMVALALLAGLRLGEAQHLAPRDVDLDIGVLTIREKTLPDGSVWKPKTRRSYRSVPISDDLRPVLERHLARYANDAWLTPRGLDPAWPMHERVFQVHFTAVVKRAELPSGRRDPNGVTYHTLRHSFASWLVMRGVDLYTVAQLLGDTLATVEATYAHLSPDFKRAAIAKLAGAVTLPTEGA